MMLAAAFEPAARTAADRCSFKPVPLPDPKIPEFRFPEAEVTILEWIADSASKDPRVRRGAERKINRHAWGIWMAVTAVSDQTFGTQKLRVFETWNTPEEILKTPEEKARDEAPRRPRPLSPLRQLEKVTREGRKAGSGIESVTGFVKFDPSGARHLALQGLLQRRTLNSLLDHGQDSVPAFPVTAISLKPVFQTLGRGARLITGKPGPMARGRYYPLAVWPGPPDPPKTYRPLDWTTWVWIDVKGPDQGKHEVVRGAAPGKEPPASTLEPKVTYGLQRFLHFPLSAADADTLNAIYKKNERDEAEVKAGDYAVLVAMHATSREITRWTWQTYWWVPDANDPKPPSSKAIAADRPDGLRKGVAGNYAMVPGYSMVLPDQPLTGGKDVGKPVFAYNPYMEAAFGPGRLRGDKNNFGVQTNCMSCHALASYSRDGTDLTILRYVGDRYVDLRGKEFEGNLKTEFLWSIPRVANRPGGE
jgi:hypothetical protein